MNSNLRVKPILLMLLMIMLGSASADAKVTRYLRGNAADVDPVLSSPAFYLSGGGGEVEIAIQWMIDQVRGCVACNTKIDVVVVQTSGGDVLGGTIIGLKGVDSVETITIGTRDDANTSGAETTVANAEVVILAGTDQCSMIKVLRGTKVEKAIRFVSFKNGGVGGSGAGAMLHGSTIYDGCSGNVVSAQALTNPFHRSISFADGLFDWAEMTDTIVDTQFGLRDRIGRLMTFVARVMNRGNSTSVLGIGLNERSSIGIDKDGIARVMGEGHAYFILGDNVAEVCNAETPLTFGGYKIWRVEAGSTFNLKSRPTTGFYLISVTAGALSGDPY